MEAGPLNHRPNLIVTAIHKLPDARYHDYKNSRLKFGPALLLFMSQHT